ncbi:hypothetical protein NPIL_133832 [Nephila pilipes]|uniref:Uncharacterized protein n=1 Tax=Nephila pilipes TaxID=299642 RepID=A0A8X6NBV1_NEPPI|nr:hypothetical protein NPIL_133832 [Nephila pilipes]
MLLPSSTDRMVAKRRPQAIRTPRGKAGIRPSTLATKIGITNLQAQPEAACMRFHWPSFQVLNQPQPDEDKDKVESQSSNFLTVPGPVAGSSGGCHNSTDSVNSCAKNTTSVLSSDDVNEAV